MLGSFVTAQHTVGEASFDNFNLTKSQNKIRSLDSAQGKKLPKNLTIGKKQVFAKLDITDG